MTEVQMQEIKNNLREISLMDKVLAPIALFVLVGWVIFWVRGGVESIDLFHSWFQTLSFFGALVVAAMVTLRILGKTFLPPIVARRSVAIASLMPVLGYLIEMITSLGAFFTVGGSFALAYISATTYWRKHIPQFATAPLGESATEERPSAAPSSPNAEEKVEKTDAQPDASAGVPGQGSEKSDETEKKESEKQEAGVAV